jgi:hypothetical protein
MRYTVAVPEQHLAKANELAMVFGLSLHDKNTYTELKYTDADGNLYAVASFLAPDTMVERVETDLVRPIWDEENQDIDMALAEQGKALVAFGVASVDTISANTNDDSLVAVAELGLSRYEPVEEPEEEPIYEDELYSEETL